MAVHPEGLAMEYRERRYSIQTPSLPASSTNTPLHAEDSKDSLENAVADGLNLER